MTAAHGPLKRSPGMPTRPHERTADIARDHRRAINRSIHGQANMLGLKKSPGTCGEIHGRHIADPGPDTGSIRQRRVEQGMPDISTGNHPNTKRTRKVKPGRLPRRMPQLPAIGSLRICNDGILQRKITDDPALYPSRRWVAVHRLVWEGG